MSLRSLSRRVIGAATVSLLLVACAAPASTEPVATDKVDLPPSYKFVPAAITVPDGTTVKFPLEGFARYCLLNGIDELGYLLSKGEAISKYEQTHR